MPMADATPSTEGELGVAGSSGNAAASGQNLNDSGDPADRFTIDESSAEALVARAASSRLLRIHDYRSGKQRGLLDALVKSTRSTAHLAEGP